MLGLSPSNIVPPVIDICCGVQFRLQLSFLSVLLPTYSAHLRICVWGLFWRYLPILQLVLFPCLTIRLPLVCTSASLPSLLLWFVAAPHRRRPLRSDWFCCNLWRWMWLGSCFGELERPSCWLERDLSWDIVFRACVYWPTLQHWLELLLVIFHFFWIWSLPPWES